jgi:outer membrane protein OmpA-like peptidoglycan-associated protein
MLMRWFSILLLLCSLSATGQNLLVNGGFEEENICSEYKVNCAPEAWIYTMPSFIYYLKERKQAHSGERYVALIAGHAKKEYYRTYVRSRLLCRLQKGKTYRFECYVKSVHPILDSIGIYFSSYDFLFEKQPYRKIQPTVYIAAANEKPLKGDTGWQKISLDYVANGQEVYIALGNFSRRDVTGPTGIVMENNYFILFDDVSLTATDLNEILCRGWQQAKEDIYAQDERHEYQALLMMRYRKSPPPEITPLETTIILKVDTLLIPDVLFASNSYAITKQTLHLLDSFTRKIKNYKLDSVIVNGHTDSRGTDDANKELSWRRAHSVAAYLQESLHTSVIGRGFGKERPIADNLTPTGRQKNRRVEILLYKQEE